MMEKEPWWTRANCRGVDPRIFDGTPDKSHGRAFRPDWSRAKALCSSCEVRTECLQWALEMPRTNGADNHFIAGCTPRELNTIRRREGYRVL